MELLDTDCIVESIWPWLGNYDNEALPIYQQETGYNNKDIRMVLKNNWSVSKFKFWPELVDKEKLVNIDLTQFYEMCHYSQLNLYEIECIKDMRRKAQKCRSSLKSQAKMKVTDTNLEKKVGFLYDEKLRLQREKSVLRDEIYHYKYLLEIN
ncbi:hypothetical protein LOD99_13218 [Oopsacas minuta]|uniref:Uncharacterized protein n=1 Tax=Oopsacas minuta TaxID=111878 RepID=A0AAV7JB79_9METZ|nr:hypothetical protein LOD99_13218 [Oopsacas minuta]